MSSLAVVLEWKYGPIANTKQADPDDLGPNPKMVISDWRHPTLPVPDEAQIALDMAEHLEWEASQPPKKTVEERVKALEDAQ